ncbi:DUF1003 domain-containing protein [Mucilaginibacter sp. BT774]|uniref:DUF1003 domain-containing protein n=1 Tax=Mucilaginibacter sp. BT774 TaxID=3062276 RepID=UPI0026757F9C|nr:DUF1003 domain-containing protein [Mucilaginibacter sp. BT774]MDO3628597.1 DUF1003 domain-containing protein [Mucilaginibacter sp. BT774]
MAKRVKKVEIRSSLEIQQSRIDRTTIAIADFFGSLTFLSLALLALIIYLLWNLNYLPVVQPFDPYPFSGLDSVLAIFAVILSICVLISQNRQRKVEKVREQVEFEINVRAETEITKILTLLHEIQKKMGIDKSDPELERMKEATDLEQLHRHIDENNPK